MAFQAADNFVSGIEKKSAMGKENHQFQKKKTTIKR